MNAVRKWWPGALRALGRRGGTPAVERLQRIFYALYRATHSPGYDSTNNGEMRCLRLTAEFLRNSVVFDVGANVGEWSLHALTVAAPKSRLFAFEPTASSFAKLQLRIGAQANATCVNVGLSSDDIEMDIAFSASTSPKSSVEAASASSLNRRVDDYVLERCRFRRGDGVLAEFALDSVGYLKIDTEGHDLSVLKGFSKSLDAGAIQVIQFEYNRLGIFTKVLLHDFYTLLNPPGMPTRFVIGRIFPQSVRFRPYEPAEENFIDGNFLAVRTEHASLIAQLRGGEN